MPPFRSCAAGLLAMGLVACVRGGSDPTGAATTVAPAAAEPAGAEPAAVAPAAAPAGGFRYDAATGKCKDANGAEGYNRPDPAVLFAGFDEATNSYPGVDAECTDFSGFDFTPHIGATYRSLKAWNLRGAKFQGAKISFAVITEADFAGTDLRELNFGYTTIDGKGDPYTQGTTCAPDKDFAVLCLR